MSKCSGGIVINVATIALASCGGGGGGVNGSQQFTISGTASGLSGLGLVLQVTGAGSVAVTSDGPFQFPTAVPDGTAYTVSVHTQPTNPAQFCSVSDATASGIVAGANITNIAVACTAQPARFVYVVNSESDSICAYSINASTGALTAINGSPFAAADVPNSLTLHPSGKFAYTSNSGANTISEYSVDATSGALTPLSGSPIQVTPGSTIQEHVSTFAIDPSGKLAFLGNPNEPITVNPAEQPNNLNVYHVDTANGVLTPIAGSPLSTHSAFPAEVVVDPAGKFVYVLNSQLHAGIVGSSIASYRIDSDTATVTAVSSSPFGPFQALPRVFDLAPNGKFAVMASNHPGGLESLVVNGETGAVATGDTTPMTAIVAVVDPSSKFVYLTDGMSVGGYRIDSTTGTFTQVGGTPISLSSSLTLEEMTVDPAGKFLYVTAQDRLYAFTINSSTGELTAVPGSPFVAPAGNLFTQRLAIDPSGRFAYMPALDSDKVYGWRIDRSTGALTAVAGSPFTAGLFAGEIVFLN